jgi:DNA repair protein RadD
MILRDYQEKAVQAMTYNLRTEGNDVVMLPTGAGKSIVIAEFARRVDQNLLILQPSKVILEQNLEKLSKFVDKDDIGIFSASLNSKEVKKFTFGMIGTVINSPELFRIFKTVLIDECHEVDPARKSKDSMYWRLQKEMGNPKVFGLTATPFRQYQKYTKVAGQRYPMVTTVTRVIQRHYEGFWRRIIFSINPGELVQSGHLVPIEYHDMSVITHDQIKRNKSRSAFDEEDFEFKISEKESQIISGIMEMMEKHKSVLIYCSSVRQAKKFQAVIGGEWLESKMPKADRDRIIKEFRAGICPIIFNVGILATGFDYPALDCVGLVKATRSLALYYQKLGRGIRLSEGKDKCHVYDFSGTVRFFGPIEKIELKRDEDNKWNIYTEGDRKWHDKELYSFEIVPKQL